MGQIIVTKPDSSTWGLNSTGSTTTVVKAEQRKSLLSEDIISMTVESAVPLLFDLGDKIKLYGNTYILNALPRLTKAGNRKFTYDITWESRQYDLLKAIFMDEAVDGISISSDFSLTGQLSVFMGILINNLNRVYGSGVWILGDCPTTDYLTLTFSNENCLGALQRLCSEDSFNCEFEIIESLSGSCTINVKEAIGQNILQAYEYGKGKGLYSLTRETVSNKNIITRLYAFGSSKNLKSDYRGFAQRLKLAANDQSYIEDASAKAAFGQIEGAQTFEDIYPHRVGTVTGLGDSVTKFIDSGMDFDLNETSGGETLYLLPGVSAKIHFNTGKLAGYEFEISSYTHSTKTFQLKSFKDERGQVFPDPATAAFQITAGDKYVILDIVLPQSYIDTAEADLLAAAQDYLSKNSQPRVQYSLSIDELFLISLYPGSTIVNVYAPGDYLSVKDTDIGVDKLIRVKSIVRDVLRPYKYSLVLSDVVETSLLQRLIASTKESEKTISLNRLNDVARAKRSWQSTRELLDLIFDTDGYFDGSNIKPNSIETLMLSVGTRSQQFTTNVLIEPNYEGDGNAVKVNPGTLSHYAIEEAIRDWDVSGAEVELLNSGAYFIYAKCARSGSAATILLSQSQIKVDQDTSFYHFLMGMMHALDVPTDTRWISLTYGATAINGRFIKTGMIVSQDGLTWFDLDAGEIGGKIKFQSGKYDDQVEANITDAHLLAQASTYGKTLYRDPTFVSSYNGLTAYNNLGNGSVVLSLGDESDSPNHGTPGRDVVCAYTSGMGGAEPDFGGVYFATPTRASAVFITRLVAKIPVGRAISFYSNAYGTGGVQKWLTGTAGTGKFEEYVCYVKCGVSGTFSSTNFFAVSGGADASFSWVIAFGTVYDLAGSDIPLIDSKDNTKTVIDGGLITTGRVEVGSGALGAANAGISGMNTEAAAEDNIRMWGGASWADRFAAPFQVRDDGRVIASKGVIAGWTIDTDAIYTGTKKTSAGYTSNGVTIAANGSIRAKYFEINTDGLAKFESVDSILKSTYVGAGDLSGTVVNVQPNVAETPRIDRMDFSGSSGGGDIQCNGVAQALEVGGDLAMALMGFVSLYYSDFSAAGVAITEDGYSIYFESLSGNFSSAPSFNFSYGDVTADVSTTHAYAAGQKRIDKITLSGTGGLANVICDGLNKLASFNGTLTLTAQDFVATHAAAFLSGGVILTSNANELFFESTVAGVNFSGSTSIGNQSNFYRGSLKLRGNELWENDEDSDTYGHVVINRVGYNGGTRKLRHLIIGNGQGKYIAYFLGTATGGHAILYAERFFLPNIPSSSTGLPSGSVYRDGTTLKIVP